MRIFAVALTCGLLLLGNRLQAQSDLNVNPSRVLGQTQIPVKGFSPNLLEGREFFSPQQLAVDRSQTPSPLYVADTGNNRVLAWRDAAGWSTGATADLVLGQLDKSSSLPLGPGTDFPQRGLKRPTGVAVDGQGNLYVFDAGNNRIVRFPKPFSGPADQLTPDMVIGQPNFNTATANTGGISSKSLASSDSSTTANSQLAFDANGNLWASDPYNNRVLRFPASALTAGRNNPDADVVLGQLDFFTKDAAPQNVQGRTDKAKMALPAGIGVDSKGRVYVGDNVARVLVFVPGAGGAFVNGQAAARIVGLFAVQQGQTAPRANAYTLEQPEGIFFIGDSLAVADRGLSRVLRYDPYEQWPAETTEQPSPPARAVIGQTDFSGFRPNQGLPTSNQTSMAFPVSGAVIGNEVLVTDLGNNRVLAFPNQAVNGVAATRVLGQDDFASGAPNLLEGRELFLFAGLQNGQFSDGAGITIDRRASVPHLYVADTYNNRILGWRDARKTKAGDKADIVIGQVNFRQNLVNAPNNDSAQPQVTGLFAPSGLATDANGGLWIADTGNGRVVRYPDPFAAVDAGRAVAPDVVLGQANFNSRSVDPSSRVMARPFGVALTTGGDLVVSDAGFNRVLYFRRPAGGDFTSGQAAEKVVGQPDFFSSNSGVGVKKLSSPRHVAVDSDDRLYVADTGNNRIAIYNRISDPSEPTDPFPVLAITGLNAPHGVFVSERTGEVWVAEPTTGRALRFPRFDRLSLNPASDYAVASERPLALTQDALGMLYVADAGNRVAMYYTLAAPTNAASGNDATLAPGVIASIYARQGSNFGTQTAGAGAPYPLELGDTQVLVNEQPAPLIYVSPGQINFILPFSVSGGGNASYLVVQKSTGQVMGSGTLPMSPVAPALFSANGSGTGQVAALNEDNTPNSASNPIAWGKVIQLFATGQGVVPGFTDAGIAPPGAVPTDEKPRVVIGTDFVPQENIQYSGLAPGLPGVWQINVKIPNTVVPGSQVDVVIQYKGRFSNIGKNGQRIRTTIAVKQ